MTGTAGHAVITGIGAISAAGLDRESILERLFGGGIGIGPIEAFPTERYASGLAGEIHGFNPAASLGARAARRLDRCHQLALIAAREACGDAGLTRINPARVAVIVGSSLGGTISAQRFERTRLRDGRRDGTPLLEYPLHVLLEHLSATFGFRGPRMVFSTACTASTIAISYALQLIRTGRADVVLTGGVDPLAELSFAGFSAMGNMSASPCAPFSEPSGLTLGEAAAMLIIEPEDMAVARGARSRARLLGWGLSADAYHPTSGDPSGGPQAKAAQAALTMAGLSAADIGYVNAHGTGTDGNDVLETRLIRRLLGEGAGRVPVSSLKGALGHTLAAAGAIETAMTALAMERQVVPPTANFTRPREGCDLDTVPGTARPHRFKHALTLNFAFGGNNAAVVVSRAVGRLLPAPAPCRRRVVLTGLGVVSPIAIGVAELEAGLAADRSGIAPLLRLETAGRGSTLGAAIKDFAPNRITRADLRRADRIGALTVCASDLALQDSGLVVGADNQDRIGVAIGTGHGPVTSCRRFFEPVVLPGSSRINPALFPNTVVNAGAGLVAVHLRVKGPNAALSSGQASGLAALCFAFDLVSAGAADVMLAGGAEELEQALLDGYAATKRISPHERLRGGEEVCAPFDMRRSGLVLGEGATILAVEALDSALSRGARIYAEIAGWAGNADTPLCRGWDPSGEGLAACMASALEDAVETPAAVGLVAASAMSHPLHDQVEANAIRRMFGTHRVPVAAMASRVGTSAATAPFATASIALGMHQAFLPSGARRERPDPCCEIDLLEGPSRRGYPNVALVNAAALGGTNYAMVLRKWTA